jgi:protein-S-isoprenylcysteine O-methyltransferase Ste14
MDYIGKSHISVPELIAGKLALFLCALFFVVKYFAPDSMLYDSSVTRALGVALFAAGLVMVIISIRQLGKSAAVGIPERETELKTRGMYRFTRNPIYTGGFILCAGSCLYSIHAVNFLLFAITVAVHVRIVKKEEEFLEKRFDGKWLEYRDRVPRFLIKTRHYAHR